MHRLRPLYLVAMLGVHCLCFAAAETAPEKKTDALSRARSAYDEGLYEVAIGNAAAVLKTAPQGPAAREAYQILGRSNTRMARHKEALEALKHAERLARNEPTRREVGKTLIYIGDVYERLKEHPQALRFYHRALQALDPASDWRETRLAWLQIGDIEIAAGNFDAGQDAYGRALRSAEQAKDVISIAESLDYIGYSYRRLGDYGKAIGHHEAALKKTAMIEGEPARLKAEARAYNHLGLSRLGVAMDEKSHGNRAAAVTVLELAVENERSALAAAQRIRDRLREGYVLRAIGTMQRELAELQPQRRTRHLRASAATGIRAQQLAREMQHAEWEGLALHIQGLAQARLREYADAEASFMRALQIWRQIDDVYSQGFAHRFFAEEVAEPQRRFKQAQEHYDTAVALLQRVRAADDLAQVHYLQGRLYERMGDFARAKRYYLESIETLERIRGRLGSEESRLAFFAQRLAAYEALISLLAKSWKQSANPADAELAFLISERARGRTMLDLVGRASSKLHAGVDATTLKRERALQIAVDDLTGRLRAARSNQDVVALNRQWDEMILQKAAFEQELAQRYPAYAYLKNPQPLSAQEIRQRVLGPHQALLEYFVGERESYLFVLKADGGITLATLPVARQSLLAGIRALRTPFERIKESGSFSTLTGFDLNLAHDLYTQLFAPALPGIGNAGELIVVPHGPLFYLPLEMLVSELKPAPAGTVALAEFGHARYVLETAPPIRYALSASLLNPLLQRATQAPNRGVLAFINPVAENAVPGVGGFSATPLEYAEREIRALRKIYGTRAQVRAHSSATKESFFTESGRFGTLIVGAHGVFDESNPMRSGIVLVDSPQSYGLVTAEDIFNLRLNVGLASLGACEVGLGRIQEGEGLLGLTRAMHYAGVQKLLVTLWSVEDESAADLTTGFHERLDTRSEAAGLREAKLQLRNSIARRAGVEYSRAHPFFWAAFVLY